MKSSLYETFRLSRLNRLGLLDTPPEDRFDSITRIAKSVYQTEISLVSLLDDKRQWFKSRHGLDVSSTDRSLAFCNHTIIQDRALVIGDATRDGRFADNALVTAHPYIRFYAGVPLKEPTGFNIGALCVIDSQPRETDSLDLTVLYDLTRLLEDEIARAFFLNEKQSQFQNPKILRMIGRVQSISLNFDDSSEISTRNHIEAFLSQLMEISASPIAAIVEVLEETEFRPIAAKGISYAALKKKFPILSKPIGAHLDCETATRDDHAVLPVLLNGQIAGLLLLANRHGGYPAALYERLHLVTYSIGNLFERIRLRRRSLAHEAEMQTAKHQDPVTGLPNQLQLSEHLQNRLNQKETGFAVCHIDLDNFSAIKDSMDSESEALLLKAVARNLAATVRQTDYIARVGGDEFIVILSGEPKASIFQRILAALNAPIQLQSKVVTLSASMGIALAKQQDISAGSLLRQAAQAMIVAKEKGKNGYHYFDLNSYESKLSRLQILKEIELGLERNEFELYFQPKIRLDEGALIGFEGLIRWNHPRQGLLSPDHFLPQLALTDCDLLLGKYVLRHGVETLKALSRRGLDYGLSINLSPHHFLSTGFLDDLKTCLQGCTTEVRTKLTLEILETTVLDNANSAIETAEACRRMGVRLSMDDFGTGYSSLNYFRKLPVDEVKIDRSFISDMLSEPDDTLIVATIISLSHQFQREVVAEGIENEALANKLRELGCGIGQGYHYSKPRPLKDILAWATDFENRNTELAASG